MISISREQRLIAELPRAMADIERVGAESSLLAAQMAQVLDKVSEVERSGQQTVAALATLDAVKTRMKECAQMLAEAESVSRILAQLEPLFQKDELREIASRLGSLRRSLESMGQLEEFSDAAARLKGFEDRLEKRMSSKLKEGIEQLDAQVPPHLSH
jgi:histidyl-tRNA synthetase